MLFCTSFVHSSRKETGKLLFYGETFADIIHSTILPYSHLPSLFEKIPQKRKRSSSFRFKNLQKIKHFLPT